MIMDDEKWHYLAGKELSALIRGITSKHNGGYYYINCPHLFRTENKLKAYENVCKNHDYCYIEICKNGKNTLKYNHGEIFIKGSSVIYDDTELLLEKIDKCKNYPEKSSTTKVDKCTTCDFSLFTQSSFDNNRSKHGYYRDNECMKNFWKDLREHVMKITKD